MTISRRLLQTSCLAAVLISAAGPVSANPQDGVVSAGDATITSSGTKLDVFQQSDRAVIDWRSFDIAPDEWTEFHQPSSSSLAVNRVNSDHASDIQGRLTANGNVVILNQNGVLFGKGSQIDVNGLIATTADIDNAKVMNGDATLSFDKAGNPNAAIINNGTISAKDAGLVGLVAPNVVNNGTITARVGRVELASGDTMAVDLYGDGLMKVAVSDDVKQQLVVNTGRLSAAGGTIAMTAAAGGEIINSLIVASGEIKAPAFNQKNGHIIISAEGVNAVAGNVAADKGKKQGASNVIMNGIVDASGMQAGQSGGTVKVTADNIALLDGTIINASGSDGLSGTTDGLTVSAHRSGSAGGDIQIGGDYLGSGDMGTALNLYVDDGAIILNDSLNSGDAGRTIFWSDNQTDFYGNVYARALGGLGADITNLDAIAGGNSGNGGFVETSGHNQLNAGGYANLTASNGDRGTYFLDPANITIYGNFAPNYGTIITGDSATLASNLKLWLDASDTSNVTLTYKALGTTATGTSGSNTITVSANTNLAVGARIRLGGAGTVTAASTIGTNTYTISAISGTTITLSSNLTSNYTGSTLYQGYASTLTDKSGTGNNANQASPAAMPLWLSNGLNGIGALSFNGAQSMTGTVVSNITGPFSFFSTNTGTSGSNKTFFSSRAGGSTFDVKYDVGSLLHADVGSGGAWLSTGANVSATINSGQTYLTQYVVTTTGFTGTLTSGTTVTGTGTWSSATPNFANAGGGYTLGSESNNEYYTGTQGDIYAYNTNLSANAQTLLSQYQAAKWNVALDPNTGTALSESSEAMNSTTGYSVFTTRYLERLSQSANISLQATSNITLDLQGDTMNLASNRDLTLTAGGNITSASNGTIQTNGTGSILFAATNNITIANNLDLITAGTGSVTLRANGDISMSNGADITTNGGNIVLNADRDANRLGAISLISNTLMTNGGSIVAGGGNGTLGGTNSILGDGDGTGADDAYTYSNGGHGVITQNTVFDTRKGDGTSTGLIIMNGSGTYNSNAGSYSYGLSFTGTTTISTDNGAIVLNGIGGKGEDGNYGINTSSSATIQSTKGAITLTGTGGSNGNSTSEYATGINLAGTTIKSLGTGSDASTISLIGTAGTTNGQQSRGINMDATTLITSEKGAISINGVGKGTATDSYGLFIRNTNIQSTGSAAITLTGQAGSTASKDIYVAATTTIGGASASGNITLSTDSVTLAGLTVQTSQDVIIKPRTASTAINIGGATTNLGLTDAILAMFQPSRSLIIGDAANGTGDITVDSWNLATKTYGVYLYGNDMTFQDTDATLGVDYAVNLGTGDFFAYAKKAGADNATIVLNAAITKAMAGTSTLTLKADDTVAINSIISTTGKLNTRIWTDADNTGNDGGFVTPGNVSTNGGNISVGGGLDDGANGGTASDGIADGYVGEGTIFWGNVYDAAGGNITIASKGTASNGLFIGHGTQIKTNGNGTITLTGIAGSNDYAYGIMMQANGIGSTISAENGTITMNGSNTKTAQGGAGMFMDGGNLITTTGTTGGDINITGTRTASTSWRSIGLEFTDDNARVTANKGNIVLTGTASTSTDWVNAIGILFTNGVDVYSTGGNTIINGNGTVNGTTYAFGTRPTDFQTTGSGTSYIGDVASTGTITFNTDYLSLDNTGTNIRTLGNVIIKPRTASSTIGLGGGVGVLDLTTAELGYVTAANKLIIGDSVSGTGDIDVNAWDLTTKAYATELYGNDIDLSGITLGTGNFLAYAKDVGADVGDLTVSGLITKNNAANTLLDLRADSSIGISPGCCYTTMITATGAGKLDITLNSDRNVDYSGSISIGNSGITTNGGSMILGGGTSPLTGYAYGNMGAYTGVNLGNNTIVLGAGSFTANGHGYDAGAGSYGSNGLNTSFNNIQTTTGNITLNGISGNGSHDNIGVLLGNGGAANLVTTSGNINITGTSTGSTTNNYGVKTVTPISTTSGQISITGNGANGGTGILLEGNIGDNSTTGDIILNANNDIGSTGAGIVKTGGSGNILLTAGNDINLTNNIDFNAAGTGVITFRANRNISLSGGADLLSHGGNIVLNADRDANQSGAISITAGSITTNGGAFVAGGGSGAIGGINGILGDGDGTGADDIAAWGNSSLINGVVFTTAAISTSSGAIFVNGHGYNDNTTNGHNGISLASDSSLLTTSGTINLKGMAGNGLHYNNGIKSDGTIDTTSGNITMFGDGNTPAAGGNEDSGILNSSVITTTTGNILLTGRYGVGAVNSGGLRGLGTIQSKGSGNITLISQTGELGIFSGSLGYATMTGDITLITDNFCCGLTAQTAGTFTFKNYTAGTGVTVNNNNTANVTAGNYVYGSTNAGDVTVSATKDFGNSNVTFLSNNDINLTGALSKAATGTSNITFNAARNITATGASITSTSGPLNVILNADHDANQSGAISLTNTAINTNGGYFVAGGGSGAIGGTNGHLGDGDGTGADDVAARGNTILGYGITLNNGDITTGAGKMILSGYGYSGSISNSGLYIWGGSVLSSTTGAITLSGHGGDSDFSYGMNLYYGNGGAIVQSTTGAISVNATGGAGTSYNGGLRMETDAFGNSKIVSEKGAVTINANSTNHYGLELEGGQIISTGTASDAATITVNATGNTDVGLNRAYAKITSQNGAITINGQGTNAALYMNDGGSVGSTGSANITINGAGITTNAGTATAIGGTSATGDILLNVDALTLASTNIQSTGKITVTPKTASTSIGLGGGSGTFNLNDTELGYFNAGTKLVIGNSVSGTGDIDLDSWDLSTKAYAVELYGNDIDLGGLTLGTGNFLAYAKNNGGDLADLTISAAIDKTEIGTSTLDLRAENSITDSASNIGSSAGALNISLTADAENNAAGGITLGTATVNSANGNIALSKALALSGNLTLAAGTGNLSTSSTIDGAQNLTASAGTMSLGGAIGGLTALNNVSLTSIGTLSLPSITAGSILARTTSGTADLSIAVGKTITGTNSGPAVTFVTRRNFANNAGAGAVSTPAGKWLIFSTNPASVSLNGMTADFDRYTCSYSGTCPALGTGNGLLYSYTPTLNVTPGAVAIDYNGTPVFTYAISGYLSSELSSDSITGTPSYTTGYSTGGVGVFNIVTGANTLASALGYGFTYNTLTNGLTVGPAPLPSANVVIPDTVVRVSQIPSLNNLPQAQTSGYSNTSATVSDNSTSASATPARYSDSPAGKTSNSGGLHLNIPMLTIDPELQKELNMENFVVTSF